MPHRSSSSAPAASTSQPDKLRFPLPDDYFPPVTLSLSQVQEYEAQVEDMVINAMESCRDHESRVAGFIVEDEKSWQDVVHDSNLSIVRRRQGAITITRTAGTVEGNFRRIVDFFSSETSEQLFAWNQFFFGCAVDAAVLCNLDLYKSDKQANLGIKWTCMQPSVLMRKRDECYLEYVVSRKDDQGRDVAVIARLPVEIPECPPLPNELKVKREKITTVLLVRASDSDPKATQLFMLSQCENKEFTASTKYCKKLLRALKNVSLSADAKHIATAISTPGPVDASRAGGEPLAMGGTIHWVPSTGAQQDCTICFQPFRNGHRRRHCQMCADLCCSKCLVRRAGMRQHKNASSTCVAMTNQRTFRVTQSLFCKVCVSRSREENAEAEREQIDATRRSLASSKSSPVPRRSFVDSSTQLASSTPVSSATRGSQSQQTDAPLWWSENESYMCSWRSDSSRFSSVSRNCSVAPTARSSFSSEYSLGRNSFLTAAQALETPREIIVDRSDDRIDERSSIYEVIDTKDMVPEKQLRNQQSESMDVAHEDFFSDGIRGRYTSMPVAPTTVPPCLKPTRRTRSTDVAEKSASSKSLDQCIAEQNELLQQVLSASRGAKSEVHAFNRASSVTGSICEDEDDDYSHDDGVFEL